MRRSRLLAYLFVGSLVLALVPAPVAAQSVNRRLIDDLNVQLIYVALPLVLLVEVILVYAVVRFRNNDDPQPTADDPSLEITWTAATAVILLFVGLSAYAVLGNPYISADPAADGPDVSGDGSGDLVVDVAAYQWGWQMTYPEANLTTQSLVVLPNATDVTFRIKSRDVLHSLFVPAFGIKQDAFPGQYTTARTRPTETGTYDIYCTEFCGEGHSRMNGDVVVVNESTYTEWLETNRGQSNVTRPAT